MDERAKALEELYRTRYARFLNTLAAVTGDWESAHDAVQETFARAYAQRRSWREASSLETWVWRIALHTALGFRGDVEHARLNGSFDPGLSTPTATRRSLMPFGPCHRSAASSSFCA